MTVEGFALGNALGSMEGYNATHSSVATKTSMPLVETSQTVSVVTRQQIEDQGSRSIAQAVRYTPGLMSTPYGATTRYDYVAMRGITDGSVDNLTSTARSCWATAAPTALCRSIRTSSSASTFSRDRPRCSMAAACRVAWWR